MGVLYKLDRSGHGKVAEWSKDRVSQTDAAAKFARLRGEGYQIADLSSGQEGVFINEFDPTATELLAVPQLRAG